MKFRLMLLLGVVAGRSDGQNVPVRTVAPPSAVTSEKLGTILGVRELPDGRVLIDDAGQLRLMIFDASLRLVSVVSDTQATTKNKYGDSPAPIIAYIGDSTLFSPYPVGGFLVVDPRGEIVRTAAPPKSSDIAFLRGSRTIVDARGRLVYRARLPRPRGAAPATGGVTVTQAPDSAPLVRADFDTRTVDTLAFLKIPVQQRNERTADATGRGPGTTKVFIAPISTTDDWTMTSDGTIAIIRGSDYHIDWIAPDGTRTRTDKMPFDWRRMTDEEKQQMADSTLAVWRDRMEKAKAEAAARPARPLADGAFEFTTVAQFNPVDGSSTTITTDATVETFPLSEWPDYYPPIRGANTTADRDGNVWILPATSARSTQGGIVYDIVNRKGEVFERVELPPERSVVGFGAGGTLYLMYRDSSSVWHLEKTRVVR